MRICEFEQGVEFQVGGSPFREVGLVVDGDGDAGHAGRFGGDDAVERVFEGHALQGAHAKRLGAVHIDLGVGFAIGQVFGGCDSQEVLFDAHFFYDDLYQREGGRGGEADAEIPGFEEGQDLFYAGKGVGFGSDLFDDAVMEGCFGGGDRLLADAEMPEPVVQPFPGAETGGMVVLYGVERDVELQQRFHAGFLPKGFGIDQQAIHIEDNGIQTHRTAKLASSLNYSYFRVAMSTLRERLKNFRFVRKLVYAIVGMVSYPGLTIVNRLKISGTEHLRHLPKKNVLFVSNHQTYFADVITFLHIFCAIKWGKRDKLGLPYYLLNPFTNVYYVAAEETMRSSWVSRLFTMAGALTVKRTWNKQSQEVRKGLDPSDTRKITRALESSWVITFPQGTTKAFAPGRKGTALIIKQTRPIVVPVVIGGFWRAFDKKGLKFKKKGSRLSVTFKEPLEIDYDAPTEQILERVMDAIEQSKSFMMKGAHHWNKVQV